MGALMLAATHEWRERRRSSAALPDGDGKAAASTVSAAAKLVARLLIACLFLHVGSFEMHRLLAKGADLDPGDPHNVLWPKVLELALVFPFVLGFCQRAVTKLLVGTLALEALTVWYFWAFDQFPQRLHAREHFTVNVAVAGGLLLLHELGGGRYTVDALLEKKGM